MPCFKPLKGYLHNSGRGLTFSPKEGYVDHPVTVPCGQCIGCRVERSRQWAVRLVHEGQTHQDNCFITLTYDDEHLPAGGTLVKKHFQDFLKRLRRRLDPVKIRFYHCGEYGEQLGRPHYHAILFGWDFPDKREIPGTRAKGNPEYTSALLADRWPYGNHSIGSLTFKSAQYVAKYCLKKINGDRAAEHYRRVDPDSGEIFDVEPEYATMSLKPGIGHTWLRHYVQETIHFDEVVCNGRSMKPPRYYDKLMKKSEFSRRIKLDRLFVASTPKKLKENSPARRAVRERCAIEKSKFFKGKL